jgi:hypothetical protein
VAVHVHNHILPAADIRTEEDLLELGILVAGRTGLAVDRVIVAVEGSIPVAVEGTERRRTGL